MQDFTQDGVMEEYIYSSHFFGTEYIAKCIESRNRCLIYSENSMYLTARLVSNPATPILMARIVDLLLPHFPDKVRIGKFEIRDTGPEEKAGSLVHIFYDDEYKFFELCVSGRALVAGAVAQCDLVTLVHLMTDLSCLEEVRDEGETWREPHHRLWDLLEIG